MTNIEKLIEQCENSSGSGVVEAAAILSFVKDNGTLATIALLAAADRHANAGFWGRLLTSRSLKRAVAKIKDGPWATGGDGPWITLDDAINNARR